MVRTCAVGLLLAVSVQAADEPKRAPTTWVRTAGDFELTFEVAATTGKYTIKFGDNRCVVTSKLAFDGDAVTCEVIDVEVKGELPASPKKGDKLTFKWATKGDTATLTDLKGDNTDLVKTTVEGEYKKK
jgi:hypothetical protein